MSQEPARWLDRLVGACFTFFLGALALYGAVWLLEAVWVPLLVVVGLGLVTVATIIVLRRPPGGGW